MTGTRMMVSGLALVLVACGGQAGVETGTETHWLKSCNQDADCDRGSCLCGVCTLECTENADCRWPLDVCSAPGSLPELGTCSSPPPGLCGVSGAPDEAETLSQALVAKREQCTAERDVRLVHERDVDFAPISSVDLVDGVFTFVGTRENRVVGRATLEGELVDSYPITSDLADLAEHVQLSDLAGTPVL